MSQSERYWNSCFRSMGTSLNMTLKTMKKLIKSGMQIAPSKCSSIKLRKHKTLHQPLDNHIPATNYSPRPTISSRLRDSSSTIAKPGIVSLQTRKQWKTLKQHSNKVGENYMTNNAQHNKLVSKPMGSGASPPTETTIPYRKQQKP